ncbi:MAG: phenylalanine--tRNA ligase subunit beta [Dethiobacteria bacterium]
MRVSYQWLKEYIDPGMSAEALAEKMTLSGIEVGAVERFGPDLPGVVVGEVLKLEPHPGRDNLTLVEAGVGDKILSIVCGAKNMKVGDKVAVATPGSELPGPRHIQEAVLYGVKSSGMLCSAHELGLELGAEDEILIFDGDAPIGEPVDRLLGFDDKILYLELTPNRSDCLGLINVAYEVAALTGNEVKIPPVYPPEISKSVDGAASVRVEDKILCPRYTARVIEKINIKYSPLWLQMKLLKAGIRPISNVVDITNYVMWEWGQPLHAFDLQLVKGREIIVRRAENKEELVTLDGVKRKLDSDVLVIADGLIPIGMAGVMGGENTEITEKTSEVLIEAAAFDPTNIRRTARRFTLPSEASQRFERGIDHEVVMIAQNRAALMIAEIAGGDVLKGVIDINYSKAVPNKVIVSPERINQVLGMKIARDEVLKILRRLRFTIKENEELIEVTVPLRRPDITLEEDIIEEVARLHGYDKIPTTLPSGELIENRESEEERLQDLLKNILTASGFYECISYAFINPANLVRLRLPETDWRMQAIPVQNPFSEEQAIMRTTIIPGMLKTVQHNLNHRELNQLLFEIGSVYEAKSLPLDELPAEKVKICMTATGMIPEPNWIAPSREADFFLIKGVLTTFFNRLQIDDVEYLPESEPFTHPTRSAKIKIGGDLLGFIGQLHPEVAGSWDLGQPVTVCEIDFTLLAEKAKTVPRVKPVPRYPAVIRDLALVVPREISALRLENAMKEAGGDILTRVKLFDLYEGKQIPEGKRSLAYSLTFRREEGTLTDSDVNERLKQIEATLYNLGAALRG